MYVQRRFRNPSTNIFAQDIKPAKEMYDGLLMFCIVLTSFPSVDEMVATAAASLQTASGLVASKAKL